MKGKKKMKCITGTDMKYMHNLHLHIALYSSDQITFINQGPIIYVSMKKTKFELFYIILQVKLKS